MSKKYRRILEITKKTPQVVEARRLAQRFEVHYTPKHASPAQHGRD
jgi:hypothetical protein